MPAHNYKIAVLVFTNSRSGVPGVLQLLERHVQSENIGTIKDVQVMNRDPGLISPVLEDYKNTNLGMIVLLAPDADQFFSFAELEEVGRRNEKYLVTLNMDEGLEKNFLKLIERVKASPGKPYRGCDASCR